MSKSLSQRLLLRKPNLIKDVYTLDWSDCRERKTLWSSGTSKSKPGEKLKEESWSWFDDEEAEARTNPETTDNTLRTRENQLLCSVTLREKPCPPPEEMTPSWVWDDCMLISPLTQAGSVTWFRVPYYVCVCKYKWGEVKSLSCVRLFVTPWTVAYQAPPFMGFSRQGYWNGLPFPSLGDLPNPGIEPRSPVLRAGALPSKPASLVAQLVKKYTINTQ